MVALHLHRYTHLRRSASGALLSSLCSRALAGSAANFGVFGSFYHLAERACVRLRLRMRTCFRTCTRGHVLVLSRARARMRPRVRLRLGVCVRMCARM